MLALRLGWRYLSGLPRKPVQLLGLEQNSQNNLTKIQPLRGSYIMGAEQLRLSTARISCGSSSTHVNTCFPRLGPEW